ncbi:MAG: preprotein translocase subunit SecE [Candidatus Moranbacteria bacterium]|nr:preprotein translocase subunit SecE [Candidatus Moranbacteria bacterium]
MKKLVKYIKEARKEMKKVKWPTKEQVTKYTKMVIVISLGVAVFLGTLDYTFNYLLSKVL